MVAQRLEEADVLATYSSARQRLLLFDYDGTLTPIVQNPAAAILSPEALRSIQKLAADPRNTVWIISGRTKPFLQSLFGHLTDIGLVAEHGSFLRPPGLYSWANLTRSVDMGWQQEVLRIFQSYTDITPGSRIERKRAAVVWHFRQASQDFAILQAAECKKDLESKFGQNSPVEFMNGKCVLEARLKRVNKGWVVQGLLDKTGAGFREAPDFVLCFGDDVTDEDMFRALQVSGLPPNRVYTVRIGEDHKPTDADWILSDPTEVIATIMTLNKSDEDHEKGHNGPNGDSKRNSKALPVPRSYLLGSEP